MGILTSVKYANENNNVIYFIYVWWKNKLDKQKEEFYIDGFIFIRCMAIYIFEWKKNLYFYKV